MFKKIKGSQFRIEDTYEIEKETDEIIKNISNGVDNYSDLITTKLRNQIISRKISTLFLLNNSKVFEEYPYITIRAEIAGEELIVTLGAIPNGDSEVVYLNGVLEI